MPGRYRTVGVLGGMGPAASAYFYAELVRQTPAMRDQDHIPVVMWSDPTVPDRSAFLLGIGPDPTPKLQTGISFLKAAGCEVLAVPCNTAHAFVPSLAQAAEIELADIVTAAIDEAGALGYTRLGLLATTGTVRSERYQGAAERRGQEVITPSGPRQASVMGSICEFKAAGWSSESARSLHEAASDLVAAGAQVVIAACTEVPMILQGMPTPLSVPIIDTVKTLARRTVAMAGS